MIYVPFGIAITIIAILYIKSKDRYNELITPLDKSIFKMKDFLPIGFYILEKIKFQFNSRYSRKLLYKCSELNDTKFGMYYLKVHYASKVVILVFVVLFATFLVAGYGEFDLSTILFGIFISVISFFAPDKELEKKVAERRLLLRIEFPVFLNKLVLLINAGMPVSAAWERIATEGNKNSILYSELRLTLVKMKSGLPEINAYEEFARRCRLPEVSKFVSLVSQNLRRGGMELAKTLKYQVSECWELRKQAAIRMGEEASTKMLFPMSLMFIAVIIIVATPAVLLLKG